MSRKSGFFFAIIMSVAFLTALAVGSVCAKKTGKPSYTDYRAVFEADIVDDLGELYGEIWIRADGSFKVELEGAGFGDYTVWLVCLYGEIKLGEINGVEEGGEGKLEGTLTLPVDCPTARVEIRHKDQPVSYWYYSGFGLTTP